MGSTLLRKTIISAACTAMLLHAVPSSAISLLQAYQAALKNDPQYRSAKADNQSGQQYEVLGRAGLLPQVQYGYTTSKNKGEQIAPDILGRLRETNLDYASSSKSVSVRQSIFNLEGYARFKQGQAQTKLSDAQFEGRSAELIVRLMTAYVDVSYAEDQLRLYTAQRDSYAEQKRLNDRLFEKGEGTKTDMLETQSKLDIAESQLIEANDNLINARNALSNIVGEEVLSIDTLATDISVNDLVQGDYPSWQEKAEKNNPELRAANLAVEVAEQEVAKSRAAHAPRLEFNGNFNHGKSETVSTQRQDNNIRTAGVQLTIPIYSGGYANAVSKQAVAQKEKAIADRDALRGRMLVELRKEFNASRSSLSKIRAMQNSVATATALVEATKQSVKGGIRINADLLSAQQQLVAARRDLTAARYGHLLAFVKLKVVAGDVSYGDLQTVSSYFQQ
ncbi:TolC family outer membrane protein [Undibacterium fentianense]|uniref:TolC family outer membrane protein n=1 Tax=Undibacterium fentianense TaxID=2828728 RepID=A0A941IGM3_9BURK|nr:TolC family outer membrane protein [Undibacterium fentianense]MBR7801497.1 TolC family outer membrane protein [Undibacterium fentianense]